MNDFEAVRQGVFRAITEALFGAFLEDQVCGLMTARPLLQAQQDNVCAILIFPKRTCRVEQLLKYLIVGSKFRVDWNAEIVAPEF